MILLHPQQASLASPADTPTPSHRRVPSHSDSDSTSSMFDDIHQTLQKFVFPVAPEKTMLQYDDAVFMLSLKQQQQQEHIQMLYLHTVAECLIQQRMASYGYLISLVPCCLLLLYYSQH